MKRYVWWAWIGVVVILVATIIRNGWLYSQFDILVQEGERYSALVDTAVLAEPTVIPQQPTRILFGGDVMFDRHIRQAGEREGYSYILEPIQPLLTSMDLVVVNLEGPVTDNASISVGSEVGGPRNYMFTFDPVVVDTLVNNKILAVNLGNNHIGNFGSAGIASTYAYLDTAGITYFGKVAPDAELVSASLAVEGLRVLLVNYNQFVPMDHEETLAQIRAGRDVHDLVIAYTHWGNEYEPVARPVTVELAHQFVDAGADVVIGSHPHVVQNMEEYMGKRIYYSLGNMVFDQYFEEAVRNGLLVEMVVEPETNELTFVEHPIYLEIGGQTRLAE